VTPAPGRIFAAQTSRQEQTVGFASLAAAHLTVGAIYEGGPTGSMAHDPLARLLPCGNRGGFRFRGSHRTHDYLMGLLFTSGHDPDWPDALDTETGLFTYFGDNKRPGAALHETPRGGNELLRFAFEAAHGTRADRARVPPFFVFKKSDVGRAVEFVGLAVPGAKDVPPIEDLVAVWRTTKGSRFQNYRALFTVLDAGTIRRDWVHELTSGERLGTSCPTAFRTWVEHGRYAPLEAPRTIDFRSVADQTPRPADRPLVQAIIDHYSSDPHAFERCAMELWKMLARESVTSITATRRSADGGRDAFGLYSIGPPPDRIHLDFSLEAKRYALGNGAGVRDVARLISRLKHRHFGVFVTTSHVGPQAYRELREDQHPVVVISGRDIGELLRQRGISSAESVRAYLETIGS
jgi:Restriction endonuclease AspBHI N-terminal/Restriction endonuclease